MTKFVQFTYKNEPEKIRVGYVVGKQVVDLNKADSSIPTTLLGILQNGALEKVKKLTEPTIPLSSVTLKAPIHGMDKILCIGLNYKDHCKQQNLKIPAVPMIFSKFSSTIIGPNESVRIRTDVVKSMDTFCPIGPWIVTCDETGDPENLKISCSVNGVNKQTSNTCQMVHKIAPVIERLTSSSLLRFARTKIIKKSAISVLTKCLSSTKNKNTKFVQFTYKNEPEKIRVGYVVGEQVVDLNKADSSIPTTLLGILQNGALGKVKKLTKPTKPLSSVTLKAPIHGMDKILCIGLNYKDHCEQHNLKIPVVPMIFSKFSSTIIGPYETVRIRTDVVKKVDWEVELCIVIGKKASNVKAANALSYVMGCTVAQDISARDWQKDKNGGQFLLGKSMDMFCPIGPWIVTSDETGDPENLKISCSVNGVTKQTSNTCQMVHKIAPVIERLTSVMTLLPGDIILTGTPGGVGTYANPPEFLKPGDILESEIQNIGVLEIKFEKF